MKDKERQFEEKIKEIRYIIEQAENNRKKERERVQEAMREHKRVICMLNSGVRGYPECLRGQNKITLEPSNSRVVHP